MNLEIYHIWWVDAETFGDSGWIDLTEAMESAKVAPPIMQTVGFVLVDDEDYIALTDSMGDDECGHITKIPRAMIKHKKRLSSGNFKEEAMGDMG
tara:strand:- start:36 stop:320 length:285 start_codon:yes stop_codon:yes gene_type:complete